MLSPCYAREAFYEVIPKSTFAYGIEDLPLSVKSLLMCTHGLAPKLALATNQTGIDRSGNRMVDLLLQKGYNITLLLAPEHGLSGTVAAGKKVQDAYDEKTGLPIQSMYKLSGDTSLKDLESMQLNDIDIILFDMQDSGMRHYTYVSFLIKLIDFAAAHNKKIVVFDRPNPLGAVMEGPIVEKNLECMVAITAIPLRHGMTFAEIASYYNRYIAKKEADLVVVPMRDYHRNQTMHDLITPLSPNIASKNSLKGYAFLGLLGSIEPFYTGVGTSAAFQRIMIEDTLSPEKKSWMRLSARLKSLGVFSYYDLMERNDKKYRGLVIQIPNINIVSTVQVLAEVIEFARRNHVDMRYAKSSDGIWTIDKYFGNNVLRLYIDGSIDKKEFIARSRFGLNNFYMKARSCFLYKPYPIIL